MFLGTYGCGNIMPWELKPEEHMLLKRIRPSDLRTLGAYNHGNIGPWELMTLGTYNPRNIGP